MFVAREHELGQLNSFLDPALAGHGQVVFVTGEAGAGKTALVNEFARRAQAEHGDLLVAVGDCNAQSGIGDPYLPFREILRLLTGDVDGKLASGAVTQENAGRLRDFLRASGQVLVDLGPDLIDLFVPGMGLATRVGTLLAEKVGWLDRLTDVMEDRSTSFSRLEPGQILEQYSNVLNAMAALRPLVLVLDDLQWGDAASINLLFHLGRRIADQRVLIIGSYRPNDVLAGRAGDRHPLEPVVAELKRYYGQIEVNLGDASEANDGFRFVSNYVDVAYAPHRLDDGFKVLIAQRTEGHPLFTVELLRDLQERGTLERDGDGVWYQAAPVGFADMPARVEAIIGERIGRLERELHDILACASVEGEDFTAQVIARVQQLDERQLVRQLAQDLDKRHNLVAERGMERVGPQRLFMWRFRHALFRDHEYRQLSEPERMYLHEDIGRCLEELHGGETDRIAVQLAWHFSEAGIDDRACEYLVRSGEQAIRVGAYPEALGHLRRALDLLEGLPETPETIQQELNALVALGAAQIATEGQSSPAVKQTYDRALALCQRVGETPKLAQVLFGLSVFYFSRGQLQMTRELAGQYLSIAQERGETPLLLEAHLMLGNAAFWLGDFAENLDHTRQIVALYDSAEQRVYSSRYAQNPRVTCLTCTTWATWLMGFPDRAVELSREALALAEETRHPFNRAIAIETKAWLHQHRREFLETQVEAEKLIALTTERGFPVYRTLGTMLRGWALVHQGQPAAGLAQLREAVGAWRKMGFRLGTTFATVLLADACLAARLPDEGSAAIDEALAGHLATDEQAYQAELYRLKGELLLARADGQRQAADLADVSEAAAAAFERALSIARAQGAKLFEFRATVSLCRLLQRQGQRAAAETKLRVIYGTFTEGLETPDLQAAAALLDDLSSPPTGGGHENAESD